MATNITNLPVPPQRWIVPETGLPTPEFYRFMTNIAALLNGPATPETIEDFLIFTGMPQNPIVSNNAQDIQVLEAIVYGSLLWH